LITVLSELRIPLRSVATRLSGVAAATAAMATVCFVERLLLSGVGVDSAGRATLTIALGLFVYAVSLRWLAPDIVRRAIGIIRELAARVPRPGRRILLQPR
jgi:hypothetical protein